jgi:hypothetical protein
MINTLDDYITCSLPQWGDFTTNPNLRKKVDEEGNLLPFVGNTVVFLLDEDTKEQLRNLQEELYRAAPDMLAKPLQMSTFHMTLHDLANGTPDQPGLLEYMNYTQERASQILLGWKAAAPLRMRTTWLFNMVNTSIVLGLAPADEDSYTRLDAMYQAFEQILPLGYALTPHITLAYFRPGNYTAEEAACLSHALHDVNMEITLCPADLVLQNFVDMNHYMTVF